MKKLLIALFSIGLVFSCGGPEQQQADQTKQAKGGVYYGGVFRMNEVENFRSLFPLSIGDVVSQRIANQIYEGLVTFSQADLTIQPRLAEKWEISEDAMTYTFTVQKGVFFHPDECFEGGKAREVTAHDFKYCLDGVCESNTNNQGFFIFKDRVKGADEYFIQTSEGKKPEGGVSGITAVDDHTLKIELIRPFASFLYMLGTSFTYVYPHEAFEKYGLEMRTKCVGTGPYKVKELREDEAIILARNEEYWRSDKFGNRLPYLDALKFSFIKDKKAELLEFKKNNLDMVYQLPSEMIDEVIMDLHQLDTTLSKDFKQFSLQIVPSLTLHYFGFLHSSELFKNKIVRQAFNYAIDRRKIVDFTLQGEGVAAVYGVVPPSFVNYNAENVKGYEYDPDKARKLMVDAGFANGKGFPELILQLNSGGTRNIQIAEVIQKMLSDNLNISVKLNVMPMAQHYANVEAGKSMFWRAGWVADYPDPESFLNLFYSIHLPANDSEKTYLNNVRYKNAAYDSVLSEALKTVDRDQRYDLYKKADQMLVNDAVIMPLFYDENIRLLQPYVENFPINAMEYRDFSDVYFNQSKAQ